MALECIRNTSNLISGNDRVTLLDELLNAIESPNVTFIEVVIKLIVIYGYIYSYYNIIASYSYSIDS